jgi:RND superfamily putative drug exporter
MQSTQSNRSPREEGMFARIGRLVVRHPWMTIAAWVAVAVVVVAVSPTIEDVTNQDDKSFVPSSYESSKASSAEERAFPDGKYGSSLIVFKRADGAKLRAGDRTQIGTIIERLNAARIPDVAGIKSSKELVSPKGDTQLASVRFTTADTDDRTKEAVGELRSATKRAINGTGLTAGQTGAAAIQKDLHDGISDAEKIVSITTVLLILLLTGIIFRSPIAALFPILTVGLVSGIATGVIADAADLLGYEVDSTLGVLLTVVLFGIGTDYILFILFRYRERLGAGDDSRDAIVFAVTHVGEAVASSALVVVAAFCALGLSSLQSNQTLGPSLAIAVLIMLAAGLTLIPAALALIGPRVFWPSRSWQRPHESVFGKRLSRVVRWPAMHVAIPLIVLVALGVAMLSLKPNYDSFTAIPSDKEATTAYDDLKASFPAGAIDPTKVIVTAGEPLERSELGSLATSLQQVKGVEQVGRPEISEGGTTARVSVLLEMNPSSEEALDLAEGAVRTAAHASGAGDQVLVGGTSSANADLREANAHDISVVYPVAAIIIALILFVLLRSLVATVLLLLSVGLAYVATLGATELVFQEILGEVGVSFKLEILVYLFVVAIGTDYNILFTTRVREEVHRGASTREAVRKALTTAGPTVHAAAMILSGTFASLIISGVSSFAQIGFAVSIGIFLSAAFLATAFVPAMFVLLGDRIWWPSKPVHDPKPAGQAVTNREMVLS